MLSRLLFFPCLGYSRDRLRRHLTGKTVLITGASYGIGEALADRLADTGCRLLLVARTEEKLEAVRERINSGGGTAEIFACDLTQPERVADLTAWITERGGVDLFVSNAGKSIRRSIFDALDRLHDYQRTMNLNYFGPVQLTLDLIPNLIERSGQIINISAINVLTVPPPGWSAYQASKTAFDQFFRCVGPELRSRGVTATSIYLPLVRTRMIEPTAAYRRVPAMKPDEVARLTCRAIVSRRRTVSPWWSLPAQLASVLLRGPWEMLTGRGLSRTE